jgi:membrane-associated protein
MGLVVSNRVRLGKRKYASGIDPRSGRGSFPNHPQFITSSLIMTNLLDFIAHVDKHLQTFAEQHGTLIYALLFLIVFCETGLVVTPFLPGDSLLFAVGALSAQGFMRIELVIPLLVCAAIIGDNLNYWIGRRCGGWIVNRRWFNRDYLAKTEAFFVKHGGRAIVIARFVPIVRTFAPLQYRRFLMFSLGGGLFWVVSIAVLGFALGNIPFIKSNFKLVSLMIIVVSVLPIAIEVIKHKRASKDEAEQ